ncbi:2,3-bisphosphoglycerate-independent phosphoglycerate mutase [Luteibaculum oceani]|uniref:2,3-bisphosphoglycerate-independent phosphoglycerate mutase n=1 Tax=Luteibaculum oceani TaxID=1294296 RepID=A0A5C6UQK3_9FLAO|nr:2,3-bisphosphoglycerate-independent phosphoglycerate mutase [Luteibaculum oceani]TXC75622.1 2,3-bisphosphoglycerate-independent phosphoglycerate mutase [Luteibaculum oceani]
MSNKCLLVILDGWGIGKGDHTDAIAHANTSYFDSLISSKPHASLLTDGENVGLPNGQMGNSEVGHLNIGAGRVVYQDLVKVNKSISEGDFFENPVLLEAFKTVKERGSKIHFMGLVSEGGVHSHQNHLKALCQAAAEHEIIPNVHIFSDGRDADPKSGKRYWEKLSLDLRGIKFNACSLIGRYYSMDRDKRWERIAKAYKLLTQGQGKEFENVGDAFDFHYQKNVTDEFIDACKFPGFQAIEDNDVVICFNFRTDRCREITMALTQQDFPEFDMRKLNLHYTTFTRYDATFKEVNVMYEKDNLRNTLGEVVSKAGKTQLRIAETEKYPHVTFFFSGGREEPFTGEHRIMVNSPKVATYDLQPEMSAFEVSEKVCNAMKELGPDFVCLNFANPDMVGHTGVYSAVVKAVEATDRCLEEVCRTAKDLNYNIVVIADHGNADQALNDDSSPNTAHSLNPVPFIVVSPKVEELKNGILADVAPTILGLMEIEQPEDMTGHRLF